jgi:hypothetical protein
MEEQEQPQNLQEQITKSLVECDFDTSRLFLPLCCFNEIVQPSRILSEYQGYSDSDCNQSSRITFSVLLCGDALQYFKALREEELDDSCFPLSISNKAPGRVKLKSSDKKKTFSSMKDFPYDRVLWIIQTVQFYFLCPIFGKELHMLLDSQSIFPFVESISKGDGGVFGEVFQVKIHRAHVDNESKPVSYPENSLFVS